MTRTIPTTRPVLEPAEWHATCDAIALLNRARLDLAGGPVPAIAWTYLRNACDYLEADAARYLRQGS